MLEVDDTNTHADILAQYLPNGKTFAAKNRSDSNLRALLKGFGATGSSIDQEIENLLNGFFLTTTGDEYFIELWENAVGIPDSCFDTNGSLTERVAQIIVKLRARDVQTDTDFQELLSLLGEDITIENLTDSQGLNPPYSVPFTPVNEYSRYVMIVRGDGIEGNHPPYSVPFTPEMSQSIVQCVINKLKPAHVKVLYINN